jgi:hypothetical protein
LEQSKLFDEVVKHTGTVTIYQHAQRFLVLCAATMYEAEIASSRSLGSLQKDKALSEYAKAFTSRGDKASPADHIHPALYAIAQQSAEAVAGRAKKAKKAGSESGKSSK